jgi:hypothetical protein
MRQLLREFWPRFDSTGAKLASSENEWRMTSLREWAQDAALPIKTD